MLVKEAGYDEFLAEKLARADEDIRAGRVMDGEEAFKLIEQRLAEKARELEKMHNEPLAYA